MPGDRLPPAYWAERTEPEVIDGLWCPATICATCRKRFPPYMVPYRAEDHCQCDNGPGDRLPDAGPPAAPDEIERLLVLAERHAEGGYIEDPERLSGGLAAALRSQTAATRSADGEVEHLRQVAKGLRAELAAARAAAPQPLWTGTTDELWMGDETHIIPDESWVEHQTLPVPPSTLVAVYRADEIAGARGTSEQACNEPDLKPAAQDQTPGVTREQVYDALSRLIACTDAPVDEIEEATDAVMALLRGEAGDAE